MLMGKYQGNPCLNTKSNGFLEFFHDFPLNIIRKSPGKHGVLTTNSRGLHTHVFLSPSSTTWDQPRVQGFQQRQAKTFAVLQLDQLRGAGAAHVACPSGTAAEAAEATG